jgi:hypothetical protein
MRAAQAVDALADFAGIADEVHGPDETRHERGAGLVVHLARRAFLDQPAAIDDQDAIRHGQGFILVMGHHDRGHPQALLELADFDPQHGPHLGIQRGQRLVEQQQVG